MGTDKNKTDLDKIKWTAIILAGLQTIFYVVIGILTGFHWNMLFYWLIICIALGLIWLIIWFLTWLPYRIILSALIIILTLLTMTFLFLSMKNNVYMDVIRSWIDNNLRYDYLIGALTTFGLLVAILALHKKGMNKR